MSVQMALLAPATRVASRKLGPAAGSRSGPRRRAPAPPARRARWRARAAGATRWPSGGRGSRRRSRPAARRAPRAGGAGARRAPPRCVPRRGQVPGRALEQVGAGVLDAGGLGAGQRVAADEALVGAAAATARLVEPTSVTTQSGPAAASASRDRRRQRADGRGDEHRLGAVDGLGEPSARSSIAPSSSAARAHAGSGS